MQCNSCGSKTIFSPVTNSLVCPNCSSTDEIKTQEAQGKSTLNANIELLTLDSTVVHCDSCGADSAIPADTASSTCSYCAAPIVKKTIKGINKPNNIIPFSITKSQSQINVKSWLGKLWFAPNSLKEFSKNNGMNEVKGCYIPFWCFDADSFTEYSGERGTYYYETKTRVVNGETETYKERKTKWVPVSGDINHNFNNVLDIAQTTIPRHLIDDLDPWNFQKSVSFDPKFLLGFETLIANINVKKSWAIVQNNLKHQIESDSKQQIGGDEQRISSLNINYSNEKFTQLVLPLWIGAYKFNNKTYRVCVNGQTGKIDGERPYSIFKIIFTIIPIVTTLVIAFGYNNNVPSIVNPVNSLLHTLNFK